MSFLPDILPWRHRYAIPLWRFRNVHGAKESAACARLTLHRRTGNCKWLYRECRSGHCLLTSCVGQFTKYGSGKHIDAWPLSHCGCIFRPPRIERVALSTINMLWLQPTDMTSSHAFEHAGRALCLFLIQTSREREIKMDSCSVGVSTSVLGSGKMSNIIRVLRRNNRSVRNRLFLSFQGIQANC